MIPTKYLLLGLLMTATTSAWALTPPLEPDELRAQSDALVDADIGEPVRCVGRAEKNPCGEMAQYVVPFRVVRVHQGVMAEQSGELRFSYQWHDRRGCIGDQGAFVHPGERGAYYLKKNTDGSWSIPHWSGVTLRQAGHGTLPRCRGKRR